MNCYPKTTELIFTHIVGRFFSIRKLVHARLFDVKPALIILQLYGKEDYCNQLYSIGCTDTITTACVSFLVYIYKPQLYLGACMSIIAF